MTDLDLERRLQAAAIRLRGRQPFFATLALFARSLLRDDIPTAATDGRDLFWNREFLAGLTPAQVDAVLLHEVLHAALLHVPRRATREPVLWNIACDIVVNGMVDAAGLSLPSGAVRKPEWAAYSAEEVYELLERSAVRIALPDVWRDLFDNGEGGDPGRRTALEAHWRQAHAQAATLARSLGQGDLPDGLAREWGSLEASRLDWRSYLWRFLVRTPTDFAAFDHRLIHRGLYLETLQSESLRALVCIDTSASIGPEELATFYSELLGILRAYPHLVCDLYFADAAIASGPFRLTNTTSPAEIPSPVGGGGTDFRPFFAAAESLLADEGLAGVCLYLTDGFGTFPEPAPNVPTLWAVTAGGLDLTAFPFGQAVRLVG